MFSHAVGSLLTLILYSLAMQKLVILMRSHLFILSFVSLALGDISVKILLCGISEIFLPMFSSRNSMVSQHIFKFLYDSFSSSFQIWMQPLWKTAWNFRTKLKMELPFDPAIPLPGLYPKNPETPIQKNLCTSIFHSRTIYNSQVLETT